MPRNKSEIGEAMRLMQGQSNSTVLPEPEKHAQHYKRIDDTSLRLSQDEYGALFWLHSKTLAGYGIGRKAERAEIGSDWNITLHAMSGATMSVKDAVQELTKLLDADGFKDTTDPVKK